MPESPDSPALARETARLRAEFVETFGESALHLFNYVAGRSRAGGVKAVDSEGKKRTLYGKAAERALARQSGEGGTGKPPPPPPDPPAGPPPLKRGKKLDTSGPLGGQTREVPPQAAAGAGPDDPARRAQAVARGWNGRGLPPPAKAGPAKVPVPETPPKPLPPPTPAESKALAAHEEADAAKYGPRAAGVLRRAAEAVRGFLTLGGLVGGAALGATVGTALGGPLGTALGVAVGGGLGGLAGRGAGKVVGKGLGGKGRFRAMARSAARKVLPAAAGVGVGLPVLGAGVATSPVMGAAAGPVGVGLGVGVAGAVRRAMATSAVSRRRAEPDRDQRESDAGRLDDDEDFAEGPAAAPPPDLPPHAVGLLKLRLRLAAGAAGVELPPLPDEVVQKALEFASQEADDADLEAFACTGRVGKKAKMADTFTTTWGVGRGEKKPAGRKRPRANPFSPFAEAA